MSKRGEKVCKFIERYCLIPEGSKVGQPIKLLDFQRKFVLDVYDNPAGTSRAYLSGHCQIKPPCLMLIGNVAF